MPTCPHKDTEYIGQEKSDDGINVYRKCRACGAVLVVTPTGKTIAIRGIKRAR